MANAAVVGILRALLTADSAEFETAMKRGAESARVLTRDLKTTGQQMSSIGAAMTKTFTLPLVAVGAAVTKLSMDFESSFAGVRKTVDATEPEFAAMAASFRALSKEIPISVNEINRLAEAAGALGIPKEEIVQFAKVMAMLGVTTNVTADQAAESIAKIQNIFGAAGKDTDRFAATLVELGNKGASTEAQILELANRIASAGNAVGLTQGQVLGFAAAIANVGIEAEAGGSAISRVFIEISQAVSEGGESLGEFARVAGMTSAQFAKAFKTDAANATKDFIEGLGEIKKAGGDLNLTLGELGFTELRQANLLRSLALSGDNVAKSLDLQAKAWAENSALTTEAGKRFETTESRLTLLWNRIKDVGITIGNALKPAIDLAIAGLGVLIPIIDTLGKAFAETPALFRVMVLGLAAIVAGAGPVIFLFGQMAISMSALTGAFTANGIAMRLLSTAQVGLTGTTTGLATAMGVLGRAAALVGGLLGGAAVGAMVAQAQEDHLRRLKELGADLAKSTAVIAEKEALLAAARKNGNDKLEQKTRHELNALKAGRDLALQEKEKAEAEAKTTAAIIANTGATDRNVDAGGKSVKVSKDQVKALDELRKSQYEWRLEIIEHQRAVEASDEALAHFFSTFQDGIAFTRGLVSQQPFNLGILNPPTLPTFTPPTPFDFLTEGGGARAMQIGLDNALALGEATRTLSKDWDVWNGKISTTADLFTELFHDSGGVLQSLTSISTTIPRIVSSFDNLNRALDSEGKAIDGMSNSFAAAAGTAGAFFLAFKALAEWYNSTDHVSIIEALGWETPQQRAARVNAELEAIRRVSAAVQAHQGKLDTLFDRQFPALEGSFERLLGLGGRLPESLRATIDQLVTMGRVSETTRDALLGLGDGPDWHAVQAMAEQYGVAISALGPAFQEQRLAETGLNIARAWTAMAQPGADINAILEGMKDEVQDVIDSARTAGVAIPASMQPIIQKMIDLGLLTDADGELLRDMGEIKFSTDLEDSIGDLVEVIYDLLEALGLIPDRVYTANQALKALDPWTGAPPPPPQTKPFVADIPVSSVTAPGFAYVRPGDILGMPALSNLGGRSVTSGGAPGYSHVYFQVDGRTLAEGIVPWIPGALRPYGVTRR